MTLSASNLAPGGLFDRLMGQTSPTVGDALPTKGPITSLDAVFPGERVSQSTIGPDTLQIGKQRFGQGVGFGEIREVKTLIPLDEKTLPTILEKAKSLTKDNGYDEIYFLGEDKKLYVMFAEKSRFQDVRPGYLGRAFVGGRLQAVEVLHVEDENNTFYQGMTSTWRWLHGVLETSFGNEAGKSVSGLVTTAIGSFVAAAALKGTAAPAVAATAPAAGAAAGAAASGSFLQTVGSAFGSAVHGFVRTMSSVVLFGVCAVGLVSVFTGIKGHLRSGDKTTVDMVTGRY